MLSLKDLNNKHKENNKTILLNNGYCKGYIYAPSKSIKKTDIKKDIMQYLNIKRI